VPVWRRALRVTRWEKRSLDANLREETGLPPTPVCEVGLVRVTERGDDSRARVRRWVTPAREEAEGDCFRRPAAGSLCVRAWCLFVPRRRATVAPERVLGMAATPKWDRGKRDTGRL